MRFCDELWLGIFALEMHSGSVNFCRGRKVEL